MTIDTESCILSKIAHIFSSEYLYSFEVAVLREVCNSLLDILFCYNIYKSLSDCWTAANSCITHNILPNWLVFSLACLWIQLQRNCGTPMLTNPRGVWEQDYWQSDNNFVTDLFRNQNAASGTREVAVIFFFVRVVSETSETLLLSGSLVGGILQKGSRTSVSDSWKALFPHNAWKILLCVVTLSISVYWSQECCCLTL